MKNIFKSKPVVVFSKNDFEVNYLPFFHQYPRLDKKFFGKTKRVFEVKGEGFTAYFHSRKKLFLVEIMKETNSYVFSIVNQDRKTILRQKTLVNGDYMSFLQKFQGEALVEKSLSFAFGDEIKIITFVLENGKWVSSGNITDTLTRWRKAVING